MKRKNLTSVLPGCFVLCLIALASVSAQAQWVLGAISYSTPYTSVTGGTLGPSGYVSATGNGLGTSDSPYDVIVQAYVDVPSVTASAVMGASQTGYWSGSSTSTPILINMEATTWGYYQDGATSATWIQGQGSGTSAGDSVDAGSSTKYYYPDTFSFDSDEYVQDLNPSGMVNVVSFIISANCNAYNTGAVTYATAWAYFAPSVGAGGGGGMPGCGCDTRVSNIKWTLHKKVANRTATSGMPNFR